MADLNVQTERVFERFEPLFLQVLASRFAELPEKVRETHQTVDVARWQGHARILRGTSLWSRLLGRLFSFPRTSDNVPVEVIKSATPTGEIWRRRFGQRKFSSKLEATSSGMTERFGPFTFLLALEVRGQALHYPVVSGRFGAVPLPKWLLPVSESREYVADDRFHFDVKLLTPITRDLLVRYQGTLVAASDLGEPQS